MIFNTFKNIINELLVYKSPIYLSIYIYICVCVCVCVFVCVCVCVCVHKQDLGGARGVMVILAGNGHGDTSSNPG